MLKRVGFLTVLGFVLCAMFIVMQQDAQTAEKPKGTKYTSSFAWTVYLDTTVGVAHDTTITSTGGNQIFYMRGLENYGTLNGYIYGQVTSLDTGDAAADVPDTSKDSMLVRVYTGWDGITFKKQIRLDSLFPAGSWGDTIFWTLSDSALGDRVWVEFITAVADSDYSVARAAAGIHYKATVYLIAKP